MALLAVDSFTSRAAGGRGYDHRGQHSCPEHAHSASVDPRIISWAHRTPQRWTKAECSSFATARRHAEAATSATKKIVGGVPLRCPSLAPPVQTAAPSSDARDTCHVRRNLSTQVKYFFHAERSGLMGKQLFGAVRGAPDGDDERLHSAGAWRRANGKYARAHLTHPTPTAFAFAFSFTEPLLPSPRRGGPPPTICRRFKKSAI